MDISVGKTFAWSPILTIVLLVVPVLAFSLPGFGGRHFSFALFGSGVIDAILALPLTAGLTALNIHDVGDLRKVPGDADEAFVD